MDARHRRTEMLDPRAGRGDAGTGMAGAREGNVVPDWRRVRVDSWGRTSPRQYAVAEPAVSPRRRPSAAD